MDEDTEVGGLEKQDSPPQTAPSPFSGLAKGPISKIYADVDIPQRLYHYTSADGLLGILGTHTLRFSDAAFLNDGSESIYGVDVVSYAIDSLLENSPDDWKLAGESLKRTVAAEMAYHQPIIFCFSRRNNLLNQWRDYGKDVVPYCIEFETKELEKWQDFSFPIYLTRIVYNPAIQFELVTELLSMIRDKAHGLVGGRDTNEEEERHLLVSAALEIVALISRFKNPAFEAEEEWRAICHRPDLEAKVRRQFRTSSLGLVPYYDWSAVPDKKPLPVTSVTVGPSPYAQVSDLALKQFLDDRGYKVETRFSTIPIRR